MNCRVFPNDLKPGAQWMEAPVMDKRCRIVEPTMKGFAVGLDGILILLGQWDPMDFRR